MQAPLFPPSCWSNHAKKRMETLEEKVARVVKEDVAVVPYDPRWPEMFQEEKEHLLSCLPNTLITRIEHFGSTAVPGLSAKPIVDMLIEVTHPRLGPIGVPGTTLKMSATPGEISRAHPDLGEHTDEILKEFLDMQDQDIAEWRARGAI